MWMKGLLALVAAAVCGYFWLWNAKRVLSRQRSAVENAARQYARCGKRAQNMEETMELLDRSENAYRHAVDVYNQGLKKFWLRLPARLMGYYPWF